MKLTLKDFQEDAVARLVTHLRRAAVEAHDTPQVALLTSPTGSGKTVIMTAAIEQILDGDPENLPDKGATFLWITDQPELNEQTRQKMLKVSRRLGPGELLTIDAGFDEKTLRPGRVYFLNTQKLGKDKLLVSRGDTRNYTIWDTIGNTALERGGHFYVIIDEAHRGMGQSAAAQKEANTIVQKFILGSEGEIPPMPVIVGVTATPDRFERLLSANGGKRTQRPVRVSPEEVRGSGLLKETIHLIHPAKSQPSDLTMLRAAANRWVEYRDRWKRYCDKEGEPIVHPILIVQVQDGTEQVLTRTNLAGVLDAIRDEVGLLPDVAFAHSFQEGTTIKVGEHTLRYLAPSEIDDDPDVQVVFFKTALNTGWDCPRAETMMSFRSAKDATLIAQLVGRMVRTPLARTVGVDEYLNTVALFLPHYERSHLEKVVEHLTSAPPDEMPPTDVAVNDDSVTLGLRGGVSEAKAVLQDLPSYTLPRRHRSSQVRRVLKLARLLARDRLEAGDPVAAARSKIVDVLVSELTDRSEKEAFLAVLEDKAKLIAQIQTWRYAGGLEGGATLELDVSAENIDDLFRQADRRIGSQGIAIAYWSHRVNEDPANLHRGKLEIHALTAIPEVVVRIEDEARDLVTAWLAKHRSAIKEMPESNIDAYNEVRGLAAVPELAERAYPEQTTWRSGHPVRKLHLYADADGAFPATLNSWEAQVLEEELAREDLVAWLRNPPNKPWALCVPYELRGEVRGMYPDLLFVRKVGDHLVVDLIDPHTTSFSDAAAKAKGLADYAAKHSQEFGRIELVIVEARGTIKRLNLVDEAVRKRVQAVRTNEHLEALFSGG
ncbi:MAG: DEAD/DEAH box helicase family protein [Gemmatimonadota bacterium]